MRCIDADLLLEEVENNTPLNWTDSERELQEQFDYQVFKHMIEYQPTVDNIVKEIFEKIKRELAEAIKNNYKVRREHIEKHGGILDEFDNHIYGKILALDGMLGFIERLEEEYENL